MLLHKGYSDCLRRRKLLSNISKTSASVSSKFPNTRKQMKARGRRPSAFIVFECLETPMKHEARGFEIKSLKSMLIKIRFPNHRHGYDFLLL